MPDARHYPKRSGGQSPIGRRSLRERFQRSEDGASAVEFAILSGPFILLLVVILQTALVLGATRNLDDALQRASRTVYTGKFQASNVGQTDSSTLLAKMKSSICGSDASRIVNLFNCNTLRLNVALSSSFTGGSVPTPVDPTTHDWAAGFGGSYTCAKPGAIVVITAAAKQGVVFGQLFPGGSFADGSRLIQSTTVFRTEPYDNTGGKVC